MDTTEHTELGNALRFADWAILEGNPYLHTDENGVLHLDLQCIGDDDVPQETALKLSTGMIVAMSGDYFGGREVAFNLPTINEFNQNSNDSDPANECESLGEYLIKEPITASEEQKLINSYKRLANPHVRQEEINTIYKINDSKYIPFSTTLNSYAQELMFALRVKNYSEILNRNLSHFTPWSVRAYVIGHHLALKYASIYYELQLLINNPAYQSNNSEFIILRNILAMNPNGLSTDHLKDIAYRYQVLALGMETFSFHYYSDHFAAGHGALMGDLRALLPKTFGLVGSILVNNLHDELNRVTIYTKRPYDLNPDNNDPPIEAGGDGDFNNSKNYYNKLACIKGMQSSLQDLHQVFQRGTLPEQKQYGGLKYMPDVDNKYRQPQPLLLLGANNKIYYRTDLKAIKILSPSQLAGTYNSPQENGYTQLKSTWSAFLLVFKLRVLSFIYTGELQPLTADELSKIEAEEHGLNPGRQSIPKPPVTLEKQPITLPTWQTPASGSTVKQGLQQNSFLSSTSPARTSIKPLTEPLTSLTLSM